MKQAVNQFVMFNKKFDSFYESIPQTEHQKIVCTAGNRLNHLLSCFLKRKISPFSTPEFTALREKIEILTKLSLPDKKAQELVGKILFNLKKIDKKFNDTQVAAVSQETSNLLKNYEQFRSDVKLKVADILPKLLEQETALNIKGIRNRGGSDCFLISCVQFLKTPMLKKHLIDRLPAELWTELENNNINSTNLRQALVEHSTFKNTVEAAGLDPMHSQLDPSEALIAFFDRVDASSYTFNNHTVADPLRKIAANNLASPYLLRNLEDLFQRTPNKALKGLIICLYFPFKVFHLLFEKIYNELFGIQDDLPLAPQNNREPLQETRDRPIRTAFTNNPLIAAPNPLFLKTSTEWVWDTDDIPPHYCHHENFGGNTNKSSKQESLFTLECPLDPTQDSYNFETLLHSFFEKKSNDDPSEITIKKPPARPGEPETLIKYSAPYSKTTLLSAIPECLCIPFKRFDYSNGVIKKIYTPVDGIKGLFTLPQETLLPEIRTATPIELELKSFIIHIGSSPYNGHYISYRKEGDNWYYFNDNHYERITEEAALRAARHSYLCFFEKTTPAEPLVELPL